MWVIKEKKEQVNVEIHEYISPQFAGQINYAVKNKV